MTTKTAGAISALLVLTGSLLMLTNLYGLTQNLRPTGLTPEVLRFGERDLTITPIELTLAMERLDGETELEYAKRITLALADGIAHVEWEIYDPDVFHQRVPVWENYILYLMGVITTIPEFRRYHFSDPWRSVERGIGICGDASMTLSSFLNDQGIANNIVTVPGHVMVEAYIENTPILLDADYGIVLEHGIAYYENHPEALIREYQSYFGKINDGELMIARNLRDYGYKLWNGTSHFITKKYYFEKFAYPMKWLLPLIMIASGIFLWKRNKR